MDRGVATRAPASTEAEIGCVIFFPNKNLPRRPHLRMTLEAEIIVTFDEHLGVDRTMWIVADHAAFAHRLVLKDERFGLIAVTLSTSLIEPSYGQTAGRLHDVRPMRIMALDATHPAFDDRMVLRQCELGVSIQMAHKARFGFLAGVHDESATSAARLDVFAARTVTGFTTARPGLYFGHKEHPRMGTRRELPDIIRMAGQT